MSAQINDITFNEMIHSLFSNIRTGKHEIQELLSEQMKLQESLGPLFSAVQQNWKLQLDLHSMDRKNNVHIELKNLYKQNSQKKDNIMRRFRELFAPLFEKKTENSTEDASIDTKKV